MQTGTLLIGVDGGGTKTRVSVLDLGRGLYGTGVAGPGNYHNVGVEAVRANLNEALRDAWADAGVPPRRASAAFLGLGSVVSDEDRRRIHGVGAGLEIAPPRFIGVDHDLRVAAAGAFPEGEGVVLIAGTGSAAYGVTRQGQSWRSGGWGPTIDDGGSAYWLAIQALRAIVFAADGRGPSTLLSEEIKEHFDISDLNRLMFLVDGQGSERRNVAGLAMYVIRAANRGDLVSRGLMQSAAHELVRCVAAVESKLPFAERPLPVAVVGGLVDAGEVFLSPLSKALSERIPGSRLSEPALPPVDGALLLAAESLGTQAWREAWAALTARTANNGSPARGPHASFSDSLATPTRLAP